MPVHQRSWYVAIDEVRYRSSFLPFLLLPSLAGWLSFALPASAETWTLSPSVSATETFNHETGDANQGFGNDDFVTSLTAAVQIQLRTAKVNLSGSVAATALLYAKNSQNNNVSFAPTADLTSTIEAIDKFAFVDLQANISQSYVSPFGPQPSNITVPSNNRYTTQTYRASPYIQGVSTSNISYLLRDDNIWTVANRLGDTSPNIPSTYFNSLLGSVSSPAAPWGWTLEYSRQFYDNGIPDATSTVEVTRGTLPYQVDPELQVSLRGGYETDRFSQPDTADVTLGNAIYGVGVQWQPSDRTQLSGYWEHRFFGSSYSAQLSHRLPNVALSASISRGLDTYPQLALSIPAGVNTASFLDAAYATRIPDPAQRLLAVQQFLAQTGLPLALFSPVNFYSPGNQVQQSETASIVLIGVRNSLAFTLFNVKSESVVSVLTSLPALQFSPDNTQTGVGVSFNHQLSQQTNLATSVTYSRTTPITSDPTISSARTNNFNANVSLSTSFSPKTTGSTGISYARFDSPGSTFGNDNVFSLYASVSHSF